MNYNDESVFSKRLTMSDLRNKNNGNMFSVNDRNKTFILHG